MFKSRLIPLASVARLGLLNGAKKFSTTPAIKGGHGPTTFKYRGIVPPKTINEKIANGLGAFLWWWIWWHMFTDYHHIIGHHEYPEASSWTDAELGIPPDDAEDPETIRERAPHSFF